MGTVLRLLSTYHERFNNLTNNEAYQNIDWGEYFKLGENTINEIDEILQSYYPFEMKTDLERIKNLINIGLKNRDNITAVYIHRILHDLDIEYNGYQQTKFGFSNYNGGGANQLIVSEYIEEHIHLIQ